MPHRSPRRAGRTLPALLVALATVLATLAVGSGSPASAGAAPSSADQRPAAHARRAGRDGLIAFVRGGQVFSMNRWGGDVRRLTSRGTNTHPQWSPDGQRIAYLHEAGGRRDIWVMSSTGRHQRAVTTTGDVTTDGASWAPGGERLAYGDAFGQVVTVGSREPRGEPVVAVGYRTGGFCDSGDPADLEPVAVSRHLSWSADGRIAVVHHLDCFFDDRIDVYQVATGELRQYAASGSDCCGNLEWSDLFWGPAGQLGYTQRDAGPFGDDVDAPTLIVYPGFRSLPGDTGGAPSPSGQYVALSTTRGGASVVVRARADGYGRNVLAVGSQPDWQTWR